MAGRSFPIGDKVGLLSLQDFFFRVCTSLPQVVLLNHLSLQEKKRFRCCEPPLGNFRSITPVYVNVKINRAVIRNGP
jgi:hypothetical protein